MRVRSAVLVSTIAVVVATCLPLAIAQRRTPPNRPKPRALGRPPLPEVLQRVIAAAPHLRLFGSRWVEQRVQGKPVRHEEYILRDGGRVRIWFPLDSPYKGQVIVDDGATRRHYFPRANRIAEEPGQKDDTLNRLVGPNNRVLRPIVNLSDGGMIAGVRTTLANFTNKSNMLVQQLYIDPDSGAVLKRVGYDRFGAVVASYEFSSVRYNPTVSASDFAISAPGAKVVTPEDDLKRNAQKAGLPPVMLRKGGPFKLQSARMVKRGEYNVLQEIYQGPRGRLSVFVVRAQIDPSKFNGAARPSIHVYSTQVAGVTAVLIGGYSEQELREAISQMTNP